SRPPAILVASPKHTGSRPVASGSRLPVWPAFSARYRWRTRCRAWFELSPRGLSSSRRPSSFLNFVRGRGDIGSVYVAAAGPGRAARGARGAGSVGRPGPQVAQQGVDAFASVDRVVVMEVQLRHVPELDQAREPETDVPRGGLQPRERLARALGLQRGHEGAGVGKVAGDLGVGGRDRGQPVLGHRLANQGPELPA